MLDDKRSNESNWQRRNRLVSVALFVFITMLAAAPTGGRADALPNAPVDAQAETEPIPLIDHAGISPALDGVRVDSAEVRAATNTVQATLADLAARESGIVADIDHAIETQATATELIERLEQARIELDARRAAADETRRLALERRQATVAEITALDATLDEVNHRLREASISSYMAAGHSQISLTDVKVPPVMRKAIYASEVIDSQLDDVGDKLELREAAADRYQLADAELSTTDDELVLLARVAAETEQRTLDQNDLRNVAAADQARLEQQRTSLRESFEAELAEEKLVLAQARRGAMVVGMDFPLVVLDAFIKATANQTECGVRWEVLAGISHTESQHGSYRGASVSPTGMVTPEIIGIQLNGRNNTAVIRDTDGGSFDRDTDFDRAVGPFQFIPSSWGIYGLDGDGDGKLDPHNFYDAAFAAAEHLCRDRSGLDTTSGLRSAVFGYNRSNSYVNAVLRRAELYDRYGL